MTKNISALLLTAAVLGTTLSGCSGAGTGRHTASSSNFAPQIAPQVEKALADRQFARALSLAEGLVSASHENAEYRVLLGRAYLANGRYSSARAAFADAMTLGNRDVRTIISLALSDTALGNGADAHAFLAEHKADLPPEDYGLAMALTGDAEEGVRALVEATRQPRATARTRQNLAFALAVGGAWGQARLIAGQDLTAKEAEKRIGQWSHALLQHDPGQRVAAMTGILPRSDDAGMPVHLALNQVTAPQAIAAPAIQIPALARVDQAEVEPRSVEVAHAPAQELELPALAPAVAMIELPSDEEPATSLAGVIEDIQPLSEAPMVAEIALQKPAASIAPAQIIAPVEPVQTAALGSGSTASLPLFSPSVSGVSSGWVVQIGAYNSIAVARERGRTIVRSHAALSNFEQVYSQVTVKGRVFHRLAVTGFADRAAANSLCNALTRQGQDCFVRLQPANGPRMARATPSRAARKSAAPRQYASR